MERGSYAAPLALAGVAGIAVMGVVGSLEAAGVLGHAFDLDDEYTIPAYWSGLLLLTFALQAFRLARTSAGTDRVTLLLVTALLLFLALDEVLWLHERLDFQTGVDWQVIYVPLGLAFAWSLWRVTADVGRRSVETRMIIAGLAAWFVAMLLEALAYSEVVPSLIDLETMSRAEVRESTDTLLYNALAIPEELLEMAGSLLLALAFARVVSRRLAARH